MQITSSLTTNVSIGSVALAVALVACFTFTAVAQEKGATKLLPSKPGQSVSCEMPAMSCPKCKDSLVTIVERPTKTGAKAETRTEPRHECPGCHSTVTTSGNGKARAGTVKHTCTLNGSESASCCAMK